MDLIIRRSGPVMPYSHYRMDFFFRAFFGVTAGSQSGQDEDTG
ncbi:hypothetical protein L21SP2_0560 [Salinispira pacifica]|uniref:Uncharacterized protein n=1 Tax=Salinispira pacifica TaxID=1307761 RepID=V5WDX6_9SPIO|nr:hypothetical protein L21SP2_0560 [Salinispira pacifica]